MSVEGRTAERPAVRTARLGATSKRASPAVGLSRSHATVKRGEWACTCGDWPMRAGIED